MPKTIDLNLEMNDAYRGAFYDTSRWLVLMGGAGSGKSVSVAQKTLIRCMQDAGHRFLVVRKVQRTLRQSCYQLLKDWIARWELGHLWSAHETDLTLRFTPNGSEILFAGLDDSEKIKSIAGISSIWIEEATEVLPHDLEQLSLRLRGETPSYKQITLSFNPISSRHFLKTRFFDKKHPDSKVLVTTFKDNRFLDRQYVQTLEQLEGNDAQVYRDARWGCRQGLVFAPFEQGTCPRRPDETIYGLDFGFTHPTALIQSSIIDGRPYVKELVYQTSMTSADIARRLDELKVSRLDAIYCDGARPESIEDLKRAGYNAQAADKGQGSVLDGISKVIGLKPVIDPSSENLLAELDSYSWKTDASGQPLDAPEKMNDDLCDAMRYALASHKALHTGAKLPVIKPAPGRFVSPFLVQGF